MRRYSDTKAMPIIKRLRGDVFLRHNATLFIGAMATALLNYLYHPVLGRLMDVEGFGEVQVLISLLLQLSVLLSVFGIIATNIVTHYNQEVQRERLSALYSLALYLNAVLLVLFLIAIPYLMQLFQFDSPYPFVALSLAAAAVVPYTFQRAYIQGLHDFVGVSVSSVLIAGGRLLISAALVLAGLATFGAIAAIVLAQVLGLLYSYRRASTLSLAVRHPFDRALYHEVRYGGLVFVVLGAITFLYSADIMLVRYFLPPEISGLYGGVATVARIIFFATSSVASVLLPMVTLGNASVHRSLLMRALVLVGVLGGGACLLFALFPKELLTLLIGERYSAYASLLPLLSLQLLVVSVLNVIFYYYLAIRRAFVVYASFAALLVVALLSAFFHASATEIVLNFLYGSLLALALVAIDIIIHWRRTFI